MAAIEGQQAQSGTDATTVEQVLGDEITVSNWPYYIDQNDDATSFPTLDQFTQETGVKVNYLEDINSNEEFFGEIQAPLSRGQGIDRDIIVPTAWLAARLLDLGYLQKLDKSAIPNFENLEDTLASPPWDPNRDYSLPWQSYITGVGYDPKKVGGEITSVEQLLDPALKGKVTMLDSMEDTAALFLLEMGGDLADPDRTSSARSARSSRTPSTTGRSASSRATTTRACSPAATRGPRSPGRGTSSSSSRTTRTSSSRSRMLAESRRWTRW